jgi:hypothetical protein
MSKENPGKFDDFSSQFFFWKTTRHVFTGADASSDLLCEDGIAALRPVKWDGMD